VNGDQLTGNAPDPVLQLQQWIDRLDAHRRVIWCRPELVDRIRAEIDREGVGGLVRVIGDQHVPPETLRIMRDPDAIARQSRRSHS